MPHPGAQKPRLHYRPDIDGLRAVAVLLVLAAHLRTRAMGGYIGVDVFFVISGYLISSVILSDLNAGRFSIVNFYERRIRRIFPAMLVMMAATTALVYRFFPPAETESYARSLLAALFSASNMLFWFQAGYFDAASTSKPLLHTWSLAVEEQFYIVFPLLLILVRRYLPQRLKASIFTVAALSLAAAAITVLKHPSAAFYFAPLRAWELLAGTIVSQRYLPTLRTALARNLTSASGLLLILIPALRYSDATRFPGLAAIPPCLGAALIIAAGETGPSVVGRLLSLRPVVFIGLISYSLYLWHWPILVFQNTHALLLATLSPNRAKLAVLAASLVLATLSWAFVEQPFRTGRFRPGRRAVFALNGAAVAAIALFAVVLVTTGGLPKRFPPEAQRITAFLKQTATTTAYREKTCFVDERGFSAYQPGLCLAQHPGRPSVLLIGDSHALQLYPGLVSAFPQADILEASSAGCMPPLKLPPGNSNGCALLGNFIYQDFLSHHHVDQILLAGRWDESQFAFIADVLRYAQSLGTPVTLVGPNIEYTRSFPSLLIDAIRTHRVDGVAAFRDPQPQRIDALMQTEARTVWHTPYISIYSNLCRPVCPLFAQPDAPLLIDTDHFSIPGSILFAQTIRDQNQLSLPPALPLPAP